MCAQAHQAEQVKEENGRLEAAAARQRFVTARAQAEAEKLQAQVAAREAEERQLDAAIREASAQVAHLTAAVADAEKVGGGPSWEPSLGGPHSKSASSQ